MQKFQRFISLASKQNPKFLSPSFQGFQASNFQCPQQKAWSSSFFRNWDQYGNRVETVSHFLQMANELDGRNDVPGALQYYTKALENLTRYSTLQSILPSHEVSLIAHIYMRKGSIEYQEGKNQEALLSFQKARDFFAQCSGMELLTAECFANIGSLHLELGNCETAIKNLQMSYYMYEMRKSEEYVVKTAHALSLAFSKIGCHEESVQYLKKCIQIKVKLLGEKHKDCANFYMQAGEAMMSAKRYKEALESFKKALQIKVELVGPKHPDISKCYSQMGFAYSALGKSEDALQSFMTSLWIKQKSLGNGSKAVLEEHINIGNLHFKIGAFEKALESFETALKICNKSKMFERSAFIHYKLGSVYLKLDEPNAAIKRLEEGLKIKNKRLGLDEEPSLAEFYEMFGLTYFNMRKFDKAKQFYTDSLRIYIQENGKESEEAIRLYTSLGLTESFLNNHELSMENYEHALKGQIAALGEKHYKLGYTYHHIANLYYEKKNFEKAVEFYNKAIDSLAGEVNSDNVDFMEIHIDTAFAFREMKKFEEAIQNFEQAMHIAIQNFGIGYYKVTKIKKELQILYKKEGKFEQLEKLQRLLGF